MSLEDHNILWGQKVDDLKFSDPFSGKIREIRREDIINAILVVDILPNEEIIRKICVLEKKW